MVGILETNTHRETVKGKPELTQRQQREADYRKQQADVMKVVMSSLKADPTDSSNGLKPTDMLQVTTLFMDIESRMQKMDADEELREAIKASMSSNDMHLVGKNVKTKSDSIFIGKDGALLAYEVTDDDIRETQLKILDEKGDILASIAGKTEKGTHRLHWDGKTEDDRQLEPGAYSILAIGKNSEQQTSFLTTYAFPRVQELEYKDEEKALILQYPDKSLEHRPYNAGKERLSIAAPYAIDTAA